MSMKLMVRVLEEIDVTRPQQLVLLSMAENARDDGSKCFPSVDLIAWKAGYKPRAVIDIMRDLRQMGVLEVVAEHRAQRATEYHIHLDRAPRKPSFDEWQAEHGRHKGVRRGAVSREETAEVQSGEGCNLTSGEVQSHVREVQSHVQNTRENAPEPVIEPVKGTSKGTSQPTARKAPRRIPYTDEFNAFWAAYPKGHGVKKIAFEEWQKIAPDKDMVEEIRSGLEAWKACDRWQRGYIRDAERFLKHHMWESDPPADDVKTSNVTPFQNSQRKQDGWSTYDIADYARELERQGQ